MRHRGRLLDVLDRAENGPLIDEKEFEGRLVAQTAKRLIGKHGLKCNAETVIPADDAQADRLFEAGLEFAVEVGMLCTNTLRRIVWTRQEYEESLRYAPHEAILGAGADAAFVQSRMPEASTRLMVVGGPFGVGVPENLFVPLMLSYARESLIDVIDNPTLERVYGRPGKAASPWEVLGGWREAELSMQVVAQAGRPGMCIAGVELSPTALGEISASSWGGFRPTDLHHVAGVSEFKTNYESLSKIAHVTRIGGAIYAFMASIYGGYMGGAEGVALGLTAAGIVLNQNYMPTVMSLSSVHPFLQCTTTRELLWAFSMASQALSRNTRLIFSSLVRPSAGPGTKGVLYENAAFGVMGTVSGQSFIQSSMTASGTHARHASGLDARMSAEASLAALGMSREEANQLVLRILEVYEPWVEMRDVGQPFEEVYDLLTISPTPSWQATYDEVKEHLIRLGLALPAAC